MEEVVELRGQNQSVHALHDTNSYLKCRQRTSLHTAQGTHIRNVGAVRQVQGIHSAQSTNCGCRRSVEYDSNRYFSCSHHHNKLFCILHNYCVSLQTTTSLLPLLNSETNVNDAFLWWMMMGLGKETDRQNRLHAWDRKEGCGRAYCKWRSSEVTYDITQPSQVNKLHYDNITACSKSLIYCYLFKLNDVA